MAEDKVYLLTQEAYNKMKEELAHREGELREEIAHKIAVARAEGDLSENGGYQAAREAQSKNEGRITELTVKLRDSKIIENAPEGTVGEGSVVTIELNGNEMTYVLGSRDIVAGTDYDIMTPVPDWARPSRAPRWATSFPTPHRRPRAVRDGQGRQAAGLS